MDKSRGALARTVLLIDSLQMDYSQPVAGNRIYLKKFPLSNQFQKIIDFELKSFPSCYQTSFLDRFGNKNILLSRSLPHHSLTVEIKTKVKLKRTDKTQEEPFFSVEAWKKKKIPSDLEEFCLESAQVILTPVTRRIAETLARTAQNDLEKTVIAIRGWVARQINYKTGVTQTTTLSSESLRLRQGVCQDITHVFLSLVRSLRIPARYVSGYQVGGTEMHSWSEVYFPASERSSGQWRAFDPTEKSDDLPKIAVAIGRDYQDARPIAGNFFSLTSAAKLQSQIKVEWLQ